MLEAYQRATHFAPLGNWSGLEGCTVASRLASNLGAVKLATRLAVRAWQQDRHHPLARFEYGMLVYQWRGPLFLWLIVRDWQDAADHPADWCADIMALKSRVASDLRDFYTAEYWLEKAETLAPRSGWVRLQRAYLMERLDRVEDALAIAVEAAGFHPHPFYRPAIQTQAHLLQLLDRDNEAICLLEKANTSLQSGHIAAQLHGLLAENERWTEAGNALERYFELSPLIEPPFKRWAAAQKARVAYHKGDWKEAARIAGEENDSFSSQFAQKLLGPIPPSNRLRLVVPFVRQNFKTCAPATLAAIGRFWRMPSEHLSLVEAMCYDGTPSWQQRDWCEKNGWIVREFRLTWECTVELISRGTPIAVATVDATSAHMQALIGFDRTRGVLLLRDPSQPYCVEWPTEAFFERFRAFGPHAMVFLPQSESSRLEGATLPDAEPYDHRHVISLAISKHNRETARTELTRLETNFPDHPITWDARRDLASYDADVGEQIRCLDRLLELFPHTPARVRERLLAMRDVSIEDRIEFLERECNVSGADPALFIELARLLPADARKLEAAWRWLRRGVRARPMDASAADVFADIKWLEGHYQVSTELYRFAATVQDFREPAYQAWFIACKQTGQTQPALKHLEDRFRRFGNRSSQPALTLAWAMDETECPERARTILAQAIEIRPRDGYLQLRAAVLNARLGSVRESDTLMASAKGTVRENDWLRSSAEIAEIRFDPTATLRLSRAILELEPLAVDAHSAVARSLAQLEGRESALCHLRNACAIRPHHCRLRRTLLEWTRGQGWVAVLAVADDFLKLSPGDAWMRRERAWALANLSRLDEGFEEIMEARRMEPRNPTNHSIAGFIEARRHHAEQARDHFRRAIELSVDDRISIHGLLDLAANDTVRKEDLAFIEQELIRQVVRGDGLLAYLTVARPVLAPDLLLNILNQAHKERPDLWHAWSALTLQLLHLGRLDEALQIARQAVDRFPHLPRLWLELADIHRHRHDVKGEIESAQRAFELAPAWSRAAFTLAGALERHHSVADAKPIFVRALHHAPKDPQLHARLGYVQWRLHQPDEAISSIETALKLAPDFPWAWDTLRAWCTERGKSDRPYSFALELTESRPGEAQVWLALARTLQSTTSFDKRLAAVNRAIELDPMSLDAWDLKVEMLANHREFDGAIETARSGIRACTGNLHVLRGRLAWIDVLRGRLPDAITAMRAVLADNTGYLWGREQLVAWLLHQENYEDAETEIRHLLKLQPGDSWANRQLAIIRQKRGDRAGAQEVYQAALAVTPTDKHAAESLFDLQLECSDLEGAVQTLRLMMIHHPGARTTAREVMLLVRSGEREKALPIFAQLLLQADSDPWPIDATVRILCSTDLDGAAFRIVKKSLRHVSCNPQTAATAIQIILEKRQYFRAVWEFNRIAAEKARGRSAQFLARGLARLNARLALRMALRLQAEIFRSDDDAWGYVGFALVHFKRHRAVVNWLSDWQSRMNIQPWMVFNYCYGLRHLGRYAEAEKEVDLALKRWGQEVSDGADLRLFRAIELAIAGSTQLADSELASTHVRTDVAYDQYLSAMTQALIDFQKMKSDLRRKGCDEILERLDAKIPDLQILIGPPDIRNTFRRVAEGFRRDGAGWSTRLWFAWRLHWQWLLLPIAPVAVIVLVQPPILIGVMLYWSIKRFRTPA